MTDGIRPIPQVETDRLALRAPRQEDLPAFARFFADQTASRFVGGVKTRAETWRALASVIGHWHFRGFGLWTITFKDSAEPVGYCGGWAPEGWPEQEIGYSVFPAFQRQGIAGEAIRASLDFVYRSCGWQTAVSYVHPDNIASQRTAQSCGATREGNAELPGGEAVQVWRHLTPQQLKEQPA